MKKRLLLSSFFSALLVSSAHAQTYNLQVGEASVLVEFPDNDQIRVRPFGAVAGNTGGIKLYELTANGGNYVGFRAPNILGSDNLYTLPNGYGTAGYFLRTDGAGGLTWNGGSDLFTAGTGLSWSSTTLNSVWTTNGTHIHNNNSDNVGIGITAPAQKLHVVGNTRISSLASADRLVYANASGDLLVSTSVVNANSLIDGAGTLNYLSKWTPDGNTLGNSQIFDNATNVGIGTTAPAYKLDVNGSIGLNRNNIHFQESGGSVATDGSYGMYWHNSAGSTPSTAYAIYRTPGAWTGNTYQQLRVQFDTGIELGAGTGSNAGYDRSYVNVVNGKGLMVTSGNVGIGTTAPLGKLEIEGDFFNQELTGTNIYNTLAQNVAWDAAATVVDLGVTDYVRVVKGDGTGANNSSILVVASVTVTGNDILFAAGIGGYQQVQALMNGMATFTVTLQRSISGSAWTDLIRQSAICGFGVGDYYMQYNNIPTMNAGDRKGDMYRFPNSVSISYFDDPGNGNVDYRLVITPGGFRKNGGNYQVIDRNLTAVQIKR